MITISVCMIVKDEEKVLARCLDSLKGLADEIIIVDTGSTDRTKEIALRYTGQLYDFEWVHDFSAARNFSISKATKDYIYIADADEVIDEENRQRFLKLKQILLPEIDVVQMLYTNQLEYNTTYNYDTEYRPKLYKRLRSFRFVDPVHESVDLNPVIYDSDIVIQHMPLSNHAERDFLTFRRAIVKDGKLSSKLYEMYAKELFISGTEKDFMDALDYYERILLTEECNERERKIGECILVKCHRLNHNLAGMMKFALKNIADGKGSSEICYELGEYYYEAGDYTEATIWYYNAAYETECELNIRYAGDYPLKRLSECYHEMNNRQQEEAYLVLYEAWRNDNMR